MASDLLKNSAAEHHGKHHRTTVPDAPSNDGKIQAPKSKHDDKRNHRKERNLPKERKTVMNNRISKTLGGMALSLLLTLGLPIYGSAKAA